MKKLKQWVLNRKFVIDSFNVAKEEYFKTKLPEVFKTAQKDILETMADDLNKQADELAKEKLQDLLSPIDWNLVVRMDQKTRQVYVGKDLVDPARLANLKAERNFLLESDMWKIITETAKAEAHQSMFVKGETLDDMKKGKIMLFTISQQQNILNVFR